VAFGSVLGADGRMFRTRAGETVRLADLLHEAVDRALAVVKDKNPDLTPEQMDAVARAVGIGAVKYADLSTDRVQDYVFDWDRMLALNGNTAPYLQYAHARARSIFRRAGVEPPADGVPVRVAIHHPAERDLALKLLAFDAAVQGAIDGLRPHRICTYLYELAQTYSRFFEECPVLKADSDELRQSRLDLCDLTARVLSTGLGLLGIDAPTPM
jgi:arginyl-tRNA synthetase